jgi:hypothetical protein
MKIKLWIVLALAMLISFWSHAKGGGSNSVYFAAASQNDVATLQQFFATNASASTLRNELLRTSVLSGQKDTTEYLLSQGADVNEKGFFNLTPLAHLAMYGTHDDAKSAEVAKVLIAHGATIDPVDQYGGTPLLHAVESRKSKMSRVLLQHGANITVRYYGSRSGMTLLHMAVADKDKDMVAVLLEFKAPVDAVDRDGTTPLVYAEAWEETEIAAMLRAADPVAAESGPKYSPLPTKEEMRAFGQRIANGDDTAFNELMALTSKLYKGIKNYQVERPRVLALLGRMHASFDVLGEEAGKGNVHALEALKRSLRANNTIASFAPDALAIAAAAGNKDALDILIHYRDWNILESEARFALCKPITANVEPAVEESAKWLLSLHGVERESGMALDTTNALANVAARGNQKAAEALEKFVKNSEQAKNE